MRRFYLFKIYDLKVCLNIDMDLENAMVAGIEENIRGPEHFNENVLSMVREDAGLYLPADCKQ